MSNKKMHRGGKMHIPPIAKDEIAHSTHHKMNKEHDMHRGFGPQDDYMGHEEHDGHLGDNSSHYGGESSKG